MPHLPKQHLPTTTRTPQRITPRTGQHAITVGLLRHDTIRPLDQPTQRHHQRGEHPLHLLGLARGMETIITYAVKPFRQNMLHLCGEVNYVAREAYMAILLYYWDKFRHNS